MSAKSPKVPRGRAVNPSVATGPSKTSLAILRRVAAGEMLSGSRTFPYPHRFSISGIYGKGAATVALSIIDDLVSHHLIDVMPTDPKRDVLMYGVTDAGRDWLKNGAPAPDATQLDILESPAISGER